jgi:hypothetical protein
MFPTYNTSLQTGPRLNIQESNRRINTPSSTYSASPYNGMNTPLSRMVSGDAAPSLSSDTTCGSDSLKLAKVLGMLDDEDSSCILIVRRISKLGFIAANALSAYFSSFGPVKHVYLLPSRGRGDTRNRPASMGFVVMASSTDCSRVVQSGHYKVLDVDIQVQRFVRNTKVEITDGETTANAYIPASYMCEDASSFLSRSMPVTFSLADDSFGNGAVVPIDELETLTDSLIRHLGL